LSFYFQNQYPSEIANGKQDHKCLEYNQPQ
jgi:hypothetical protein